MLDQKEISECVETLCDRGCESVREVIGRLESGQNVPETAELGTGQRAAVLHELQRIMAVYDSKT